MNSIQDSARSVKDFTSLRHLDLSGCAITDEGLKGLAGNDSLARNDDAKPAATTAQIARLFLMDTPVTDETLRALVKRNENVAPRPPPFFS